MMRFKSLMFFLVILSHAVNAFYPEGYMELARTSSKANSDPVNEALTEALAGVLAEAINAEILENESKDKNKHEDRQPTSESRVEDSWARRDREESVSEDFKENDALQSESASNPHKRDDYYEGLEKKSQRATYLSPPRKTFYTAPETTDLNIGEDNINADNHEHKRYHRTVDDDHHDLEKELIDIMEADSKKELADIMEAESFPLMDAIYLPSTLALQQQTRIHTPPWRLTEGRMIQKLNIPRRQLAPIVPPPMYLHDDVKSVETPDPLVPKAAVSQHRGSYRPQPQPRLRPRPQPPPQARQPPPRYVPRKNFNSEGRLKSVPKPKPKPYVNEFKKNPIQPKFADLEDKSLFSPAGKPVRQQFHEQGTRGPHSYKFGYSTGDKDNPMARYEERDSDGLVRGSYSFVDARGQQQVVHYESHPKFGFKSSTSPI